MSETRDTYLLLRAFVDELVRCGVTHACTSPGSRSTPLVLSLVRDGRLRASSHVDERSGGFFALGAAKATGMPAVLACTSGTAAANYAPAVIEAHEARVPLIVLTADRPPELREVGAGQTIDQLKLYGGAAKWFFEVGTHAATPARLRWMRQLACRAVWTALDGRPGPVHLNVPLREPLVLDEELPEDGTGRPGGRPYTARTSAPRGPIPLPPQPRGIIVAGRDERPEAGLEVARLGIARGWPVLADPLSGARFGIAAVAHYDALLRDERWAAAMRPDVVVRTGDLPTSKPLRRWLASLDGVPQLATVPHSSWHDPDATLHEVLDGELVAGEGERDDAWLDRWRRADGRAGAALDAVLGDALSEPRVARELGDRLAPGAQLVVAASMPIRDVETFVTVRDAPLRVLSNRGANGIDGTTSTAYGIAAATGAPTTLLIGDVALVHDLGGLLAGRRLGVPLRIVVVDNGGGGIFEFLPVATQRDAFEEHVLTPTGLDVARIAALFDAEYLPVATLGELRTALDADPTGTTIVHVRTDRAENVALHRRCWDAVAAACAG